MPKAIIKVDEAKLIRKMRQFEAATGKEVDQQIKNHARLLCVELGRQTQPLGFGSKQKGMVESSILGGMGGLFFSVDKVTKRTRNLVGVGDALDFHKANKGKRRSPGRLAPPDRKTLKQRDWNRVLKDIQKRAGWAKSAWLAAAKQSGAKVGDLARGFPRWVKRHAGKANARTKGKNIDTAVKFTSRIGYMDKVLSAQQQRDSLNLTRGKFIRFINRSLRAIYKKRQAA